MGFLPSPSYNMCKNTQHTKLTQALSRVGGNVYAAEFNECLSRDNFTERCPKTFFTDVTHVHSTASFVIPRGPIVWYKDFLIPLFVVCALWDPKDIRKHVLLNDFSTAAVC